MNQSVNNTNKQTNKQTRTTNQKEGIAVDRSQTCYKGHNTLRDMKRPRWLGPGMGVNKKEQKITTVHFSSVQTLDRLGHQGDMTDVSTEILFQSFFFPAEGHCEPFLRGRNVHSLMLSFQHFLCRPRRRPLPKVP